MEYKEKKVICQNCKKNFNIKTEDLNFYEKIKVPPPTFCPECRMIRRMLWRNLRSLYKRVCGLCNKKLISMYDTNVVVYCRECFLGDKWNFFDYGKEYDFSKTFFKQINELFFSIPHSFAYQSGTLVNSDYSNYSVNNKNAYLSFSVVDCEDVLYSESVDKSKNIIDCYSSQKLNNCFYNIDSESNYNTHYSIFSRNCIDSFFIYDCVNCNNCCLSSNLRNKSYVFRNVQMNKEEYEENISKLGLDTISGNIKNQEEFAFLLKKNSIHRFSQIYNSQKVTGDFVINSKNIIESFDVKDSENIAYSLRVLKNTKDSYDLHGVGMNCEMIYESVAASINTYKDFFCLETLESKECEYSLNLKNCSNCFGCVSMNNVKYCILNKQYTKEEYFKMIEKIKKHMNDVPYTDDKGRVYKYGEFFPGELSPFGYNETNAHDFFNLEKEKVLEMGYLWKDKEKIDYKITKDYSELPDNILNVNDDILNEIISCVNNGDPNSKCSGAFKILENELQFYKQKRIPLPIFCPNCRHYNRLKQRNPLKLWHRQCMKEGCTNSFETSYAPQRPEIVYCEGCYNKEVY